MPPDPTQPVLIGVGTAHQRVAEPGGGLDTTGLMIEACRAAVADTEVAATAARVGWVGATRGLSQLPDAARRVAEALGVPGAHTVAADLGIPQQTLITRALDTVRRGTVEVALVCGGETKYRDDTARRAGVELPGHDQDGLTPDEELSPEGEIIARPEIEIGAVAPVQQYAMIDSARRGVNGWSLTRHRDDIAELWQRFNTVAGTNPDADFAAPMTQGEIRDPSPANRPIAFPYNKWHNSQWSVDQAAALLVCTVATAEALGVPRDRWVFPHVGLESSLSLSLSRRAEMHRWPAMGVLGRAAAAHVGRPVSEIEHLELYSCFPAAVRIQQAELALDPAGTPTVTGGMAFAGGPFNNFVYQATAAVLARVRAEPGTYGGVSVVSGLLTKPGLAVWSTDPPTDGLLLADLVDQATDATAVAPLDEDPDGWGRVATYTVVYDGFDPVRVCAIVDLESGERAVGAADDAELAAGAVVEDLIGTRVHVAGRALRI